MHPAHISIMGLTLPSIRDPFQSCALRELVAQCLAILQTILIGQVICSVAVSITLTAVTAISIFIYNWGVCVALAVTILTTIVAAC